MHRVAFFLLLLVAPFPSLAQSPKDPGAVPEGNTETEKYFPIVAVGGGNNALLTLFNFGNEEHIISVSIFTSEGDTAFSGGASLAGKATKTFNLAESLSGMTDLTQPRGFWMRVTSASPFASGGLQTLQVGGESLLPYGVLASPLCQQMTVVLNETETLRSALALLNPGLSAASCLLTAYSGYMGQPIDTADIELPSFNRDSFYLDEVLDYDPGLQGAVEISCDAAVAGYSLLQDMVTGNTSAVSVECINNPQQ